jgi:hypothetical protein
MPEVFHLMRGDTLLGVLHVSELDFPWLMCRFEPTPAFEEIRPLFEQELKLSNSEDWQEEDSQAWEDIYQRIMDLGIRLDDVNGSETIGEFLLHVEGDHAWFRY